jgi:hypothetical protein
MRLVFSETVLDYPDSEIINEIADRVNVMSFFSSIGRVLSSAVEQGIQLASEGSPLVSRPGSLL